jgi:hypothetical protein
MLPFFAGLTRFHHSQLATRTLLILPCISPHVSTATTVLHFASPVQLNIAVAGLAALNYAVLRFADSAYAASLC